MPSQPYGGSGAVVISPNPSYTANSLHEWHVGTGPITAGNEGTAQGPSSSASWNGILSPLTLDAGAYYIHGCYVGASTIGAAYIDAAKIIVVKLSDAGTAWNIVASADISTDVVAQFATAGTRIINPTLAADVALTITTGTYRWGVALHGQANKCGSQYYMPDGTMAADDNGRRFWQINADPATEWTSIACGAAGAAGGNTSAINEQCGYLKLKTAKRVVYSVAADAFTGTAVNYWTPVCADAPYCIKFGTAKSVADTLSIDAKAKTANAATVTTLATAEYDGTAAAPAMTFGGVAVNMVPGEDLEKHDLLLAVRPTDTTPSLDLLWQDIEYGTGPMGVASFSGVTWDEAANTFTSTGAFANLTFYTGTGQCVVVVSGTGSTPGTLGTITNISANAITVSEDSLATDEAADVVIVVFSGPHDYATRSHAACQAAAIRETNSGAINGAVLAKRVAAAQPYWVTLSRSGTAATVTSIEVGVEPLVMLGDSQSGSTSAPDRLASTEFGIPYEFGAQEQARILWVNAISGSRLATPVKGLHSSGVERFASATAGNGDLCEIPGAVVCVAGMGINDIHTDASTATEAGRNAEVASLLGALGRITAYAATNGSYVMLVGLPPLNAVDTASGDYDTKIAAMQRYNSGVTYLASVSRCSRYIPWSLVESMIGGDSEPLSESAGDPHYTDAGATAVSQAAVEEFLR